MMPLDVQLWFDLPATMAPEVPSRADAASPQDDSADADAAEQETAVSQSLPPADEVEDDVLPPSGQEHPADGRDAELEARCHGWLTAMGMQGAAGVLSVWWNARLRSTAGYASFPAWRIELNPRLVEYPGQVERTLKHELAHLIAYSGAGRRKIDPHGREWRAACAALGIPGERAHHSLPLPRREVLRRFAYRCPRCQSTVRRVRKFRHAAACSSCCKRYANGMYDARFRFELVADPAKIK